MSPTLRTTIARALLVGAGVAAGAGGTAALTGGAHEQLRVALGDTLQPRFSVRTDSVLKVVGSQIVAAACGPSAIFLRTYHGGQLSADTVDVIVPCGTDPADTTAAGAIVCTQTDSQFQAHPLSGQLDSSQYAQARQFASCGPDSLPAAPSVHVEAIRAAAR